LGPLDNIIHDIGKIFVSIEFQQYAKSIIIQIQEIPVEAYNSIGKIKRYYTFLQQVYKIICDELHDTSVEVSLQITIKTINDSAGPDGIILILLMFSAYPRITKNLVLLFIIIKRAETIRKTTKEIQCLYTKRQVINILAIRNNPNIIITLELPI
jgi:hypothetical protein